MVVLPQLFEISDMNNVVSISSFIIGIKEGFKIEKTANIRSLDLLDPLFIFSFSGDREHQAGASSYNCNLSFLHEKD